MNGSFNPKIGSIQHLLPQGDFFARWVHPSWGFALMFACKWIFMNNFQLGINRYGDLHRTLWSVQNAFDSFQEQVFIVLVTASVYHNNCHIQWIMDHFMTRRMLLTLKFTCRTRLLSVLSCIKAHQVHKIQVFLLKEYLENTHWRYTLLHSIHVCFYCLGTMCIDEWNPDITASKGRHFINDALFITNAVK